MTIGDRLKKCRTSLKLTQVDVYAKTGIHNKTLSGYENNVSSPDHETLAKLAEFYNVSTDYLLGISNSKSKAINTNNVDLSEEEILTMAAHKAGHDGPLSDIDMSMIKKAIKIALDK